jgi:hypothetical protein
MEPSRWPLSGLAGENTIKRLWMILILVVPCAVAGCKPEPTPDPLADARKKLFKPLPPSPSPIPDRDRAAEERLIKGS